jgi:phage shock protein A
MNVFKRIFKVGESEAHSIVDKLEDPIKMTEQGIRDFKVDLDKSLKALAEVKALAIRSRNEIETNKRRAGEYEQKAVSLLERAKNGAISQEEADRLAESALQKQQECLDHVKRATVEHEKFQANVDKLEANVKKLKSNISKWENEAKTLKARAKVGQATKNVNKQLASIDSSSTVSLLERMRDKVEKEEALSESYAEIANESKSVDDEIDSALGKTDTSGSASLAALKAKMNEQKAKASEPKKAPGQDAAKK